MKKVSIIIILLVASMVCMSQIVTTPDSSMVQVVDTTIVQDMKLLIIADRLYGKGGLTEILNTEISKEKAVTGEIIKLDATQAFLDEVAKSYAKYINEFIKLDTVLIDPVEMADKINEIIAWQTNVLSDPEIKNVTTLSVWEEKSIELEKYINLKTQADTIKAKEVKIIK